MAKRIGLFNIMAGAVRKTSQRLAVDFGGPTRSLTLHSIRTPDFDALPASLGIGDVGRGLSILDGHFRFSGKTLDVGTHGDPWASPSPSEAFAHKLHGFTWLADLAVLTTDKNFLRRKPDLAEYAEAKAQGLVDRWITEFGQWNRYAWRNDLLAERLFAWLANWSALLDADRNSPKAATRRINMLRQLKRLRITYKRTRHGLPRLKAAACLVIAGVAIAGKSEGSLDHGLDLLDDELDVQILADGGHISRSPEQTARALEVLTTVERALEAKGIQGSKEIRRAIDRLAPMVSFFTAGDGALFGFNGGGEYGKQALKRLGNVAGIKAKQFGYASHTKYQRLERNGTVIMIDTGTSPPRPFDLNAHLAPLAFEMSTPDGRLIVNCGWNDNQSRSWRKSMRATAAHSTLVLDEQDAGQLLGSKFGLRVLGTAIAKAAGPTTSTRKEQETGTWLETAHEGYFGTYGLAHRRRLYLDINGADVRGEDSLFVPLGKTPIMREQIPFEIRFHLHPDTRVTLAQDLNSALLIQPGNKGWRFHSDYGPLKLEKSVYLATGHKPRRSGQLVITGNAYGDGDGQARSNKVRWSLKRMGVINDQSARSGECPGAG